MSFVTKITKSSSDPVHMVTCEYPDGRDCYYVVVCSKRKIKMLEDIEEGIFNVNDYGLILASGFGKTPTADVVSRLKIEYNIDLENIFSNGQF